MRLIPIDAAGDTEIPASDLPGVAVDVCEAMAHVYGSEGFIPPWIGYLALEDDRVIGTCGFKSPPKEGRVEIAYFTFPEYEGKGIATQMAAQLIDMASYADPEAVVAAQTLPEECASTSILKKLDFSRVGTATDPDVGLVWEWQRTK